MLRARAIEQQIRLEVLNAASEVENSRASVRLAQLSVDFAQKRVDTELKKYDLGDTTIFFLLDAQNSLTRAEAELVSQSVQYRRNLLNLSRVSGTLLEEHAEGLTPLTGTTAGALSPALAPLVSELTQASNKPPVENRPTSPPEMNKAAPPETLATATPENPPPRRTSQPGEPSPGGAPTNTPGTDRLYLQVAAGAKPQARVLADTLKQQGFSTRLSTGPRADLFRVLVGPFADTTTLGKAKVDLGNAGFRPFVRKWAERPSP